MTRQCTCIITGSGGTTWDAVGDTGPDAGDSFSTLPFYTSGVNADFVTVNGAYKPVINMDVSHIPLCLPVAYEPGAVLEYCHSAVKTCMPCCAVFAG